VRVRDHAAIATTAAVLLRPWAGHRVLGFWAGSVLIDADHYLWYCLRERRLDPVAATRYFNDAHPQQHWATRILHTPPALAAVTVLALRNRRLLPIALGMGLHVALDVHHRRHMSRARVAALARDGYSCRSCQSEGPQVGTHVIRQPWLLPSYQAGNLVSLCSSCHEAAHTRGGIGVGSWT